MASTAKSKITALVDSLIGEGEKVASTGQRRQTSSITTNIFVEVQAYCKWVAGCRNLMRVLGETASSWNRVFDEEDDFKLSDTHQKLGTLKAIREALEMDLLVTIQELVMAEAFSDLLEQANYLLSEGYFLAAGVLGRAVLEEHLRKWCDQVDCVPSKAKPTLNDYKLELQKANKLNKIEVSHVDAMAAVGNAAAHNKTLIKDDVERMVGDVRGFLAKH
jgi:hypothetical protein